MDSFSDTILGRDPVTRRNRTLAGELFLPLQATQCVVYRSKVLAPPQTRREVALIRQH